MNRRSLEKQAYNHLHRSQILFNSPFQPQIHQLPYNIYPQKKELSKSMVFERLIQDRRKKEEKNQAQKLLKQQQQYNKHCTFQPALNCLSRETLESQQNAFDRLYRQGVTKLQSISTNEENKENFPFQPTIHPKIQIKNYIPIHQRIQQIINKKKQLMKNLAKQQSATILKINKKSKEIIQNNPDYKNSVVQRLLSHIKKKKQTEQKLEQQKKIRETFSFKPSISYTTNLVLLHPDFLKRQQLLIQQQKHNLQLMMPNLSFQPQINNLSSLLMQPTRQNETLQDKVERMHNVTDRQQKMEEIQKQIYKDCSFHPKINAISKVVSIAPVAHKCACHAPVQVYAFQPKINLKSQAIVKSKGKDQFVQKKYLQMERMKMENQYKEIQECTFKPKIKERKKIDSRNLTDVEGIKSFMEKKQKIVVRKKEEESYKEKIFNLQKKYKPRSHTLIEEFNLSEPNKKIDLLRAEAEQQFQREYTFKPQKIR